LDVLDLAFAFHERLCLALFHHEIYPRSYLKDSSATTSTSSLSSTFKGFGFFKA